jgi:aryl-alcohol dehydrogenase-like predicted oxidoreductase
MSTKKNDSAPDNKASDLNTACAWLLSGNLSTVPEKLKSIIEECRLSISSGEIDSIDLLYIHNLPESINVARELQTVEDHLRSSLSTKK